MIITVTPENIIEYPFHKHETHEIVCYVSGKGVMKTERGNIPFEQGTLLIIPPNVKHCSVSENGFKNICVHIHDSLLDRERVLVGKDNAAKDAQTIAGILARIFMDGLLGKESFWVYLYNAYRELVLRLIEKSSVDEAERLKEELVQNLSDPEYSLALSLPEKSVSADHLRVLFKKKYGCTPIRYLTKLRLAFACNLFEVYGEKMKISEVAYASGFQDELYFSRLFKKHMGKTPKQYRESCHKA